MLLLTHCSDAFPSGPHPDEGNILFEVGALHGDLVIWQRGQLTLNLGALARDERSEFVRLRVSRAGKGLSWLQRAPIEPPFGEERDRAAFVRLLGARGFLLWLSALLVDSGAESEDDWKREELPKRSNSEINLASDPSLPTLEEMLAAWARDP